MSIQDFVGSHLTHSIDICWEGEHAIIWRDQHWGWDALWDCVAAQNWLGRAAAASTACSLTKEDNAQHDDCSIAYKWRLAGTAVWWTKSSVLANNSSLQRDSNFMPQRSEGSSGLMDSGMHTYAR